uniref:SEFIR domain-containing protein n=1 Tax=Syphacia muris TaxID=451379 RepID=A0A0N5AWD5_9BILA
VNCPIVFERRITPPSTGIKWTNVPAGNYTAIAIVNEHDCLRSCNGCTVCANQSVKFFVQTDKYTVTHQALRTVKDFAKLFVFGLIATLFFITAIIFVYITVKKRIFGRKGLEERVLTLVSKPKVLIIYSYDCSQYSNCVCSLVHYLKQFANADVVFDQFELNTPGFILGVVPVRWVLDAINRVDFVLTIFSEGAVELMKGNSLKRDLPFPELFITALHHIYAVCYYSLYGVLNVFYFANLLTIKSLGELILLLHHKSLRNDIVQGGDKSELDSVISAYEYFRLRNPSWLTERIAQGKVKIVNFLFVNM